MRKNERKLLHPTNERSFFLFLSLAGLLITSSLGTFYYFLEIPELVYDCVITFAFFTITLTLYRLNVSLIFLFRANISMVFIAFYYQVLVTGGITSPSITIFVIFPLFGFFYHPKIDRLIWTVLAFLGIISMWFESQYGYASNIVQIEHRAINSLVVSLYELIIVGFFTFLFWMSIKRKNEKLLRSMQELELATDQMIQSEKMASLGILSAGVAHEINNPLNFIKGGIFQIEEQIKKLDLESIDETKKSLDLINKGVDRVVTIVRSLNHFSRNNKTEISYCNIHNILDNCLVILRHLQSPDVQILKEYDSSTPAIEANEGKLHQIFLNFLTNAIQAIERAGLITITTKHNKKGNIIISIKDTGSGISPENIEKVTDPFFTTKNPGEGTGLGLYICYNLINEQKGKMKIKSQLGKGTEIKVTFPISSAKMQK